MSKKFYMAPEMEEMELNVVTSLLAGSGDPDSGDPLNMGGENNGEDDGFGEG